MGGTHTDSLHAVTYQKTVCWETDIQSTSLTILIPCYWLLTYSLLCSVCGMAAAITDTAVNQRTIQSLTVTVYPPRTHTSHVKFITSAAVSLGEIIYI